MVHIICCRDVVVRIVCACRCWKGIMRENFHRQLIHGVQELAANLRLGKCRYECNR
jgi:hypothetical protein